MSNTSLVKKTSNSSLTITQYLKKWRDGYVGQSVSSAHHAVTVIASMGAALWAGPAVGLFGVCLTEFAFWFVLPRLAPFQKSVDDQVEASRQAQARRDRETILAQLHPEHRHDVNNMTVMINVVGWRTGLDTPSLQDLIERYIRLGVTYAESMSLRRAIGDEGGANRNLTDPQTNTIVARYRNKREENLQALRRIEQEMFLIRQTVYLAYEHAIAPQTAGDQSVTEFLKELDDTKEMMDELLALRSENFV